MAYVTATAASRSHEGWHAMSVDTLFALRKTLKKSINRMIFSLQKS